MSSQNIASKHELVLEAGRAERQYWQDLWRYRELLYFLAWRDILVRYKQTIIGLAWALIRPFLTMVVFTIVFGNLAKLPSGGAPYPILVFAAMLPWQFFANALTDCTYKFSCCQLCRFYDFWNYSPGFNGLVQLCS